MATAHPNYPITAEVLRTQHSYSRRERDQLIDKITGLLKQHNAALIAHYYTHNDLQMIAEQTGGCVADSLEMARFGSEHPATTLIVAGVRFMGETAKILSPDKRILMPTLEATCSLDLGCPIERFSAFCDQHPQHTVVVYANTSAAVKARADWVVTSSIAVDVIEHLDAQGEQVLWAPDKYLGSYIQRKTGADMLLWDGACIVHEEFKTFGIDKLREQYPGAGLLVHPESPAEMIDAADAVGSTSQLIRAAVELPHNAFIVATDNQIFYKMQQAAPDKTLVAAPTGGHGATCRSCAHCPWMAMNDLQKLTHVLESGDNEIHIEENIRQRAVMPLERMLAFSREMGR